jgi:hypothetical protein
MDGAQAERFDAPQGDLFGVAEAPAPRVFVPKREHVLEPVFSWGIPKAAAE